ncbi:unnamed protein product [Gongylonema pulchrum]|uniref:Uncharacterized protein n=1 Tax=Gongylonema pulchrum TaxID=637853 RepID=A0A183CXA1_9BILA|nr:unnamed protein product [Gongylonema pulchrum]
MSSRLQSAKPGKGRRGVNTLIGRHHRVLHMKSAANPCRPEVVINLICLSGVKTSLITDRLASRAFESFTNLPYKNDFRG